MTRCDSLVKRFTGTNLHKLSEHILAQIKTEQGSVMDRPPPTQENVGIFAGIKDLLDDEPLPGSPGESKETWAASVQLRAFEYIEKNFLLVCSWWSMNSAGFSSTGKGKSVTSG